MKKAICVILALASAFTLTGCTSVYSNFKEIEQLLVIQDMGLDKQGGGVLLSLCSASDESTGNVPKRLYGTGDSITTALEHIYNYSFEDILFCLRQQMIIHRCRGCGGRSRSRKQQIADMIADIPLFA